MLEHDFKNAECLAVASWSQNNQHILFILESTVKKIDEYYSVGLLWKMKKPDLPNNCLLAEKTLKSLMRKPCKNPNLFKQYSEKMSEYISNYSETVSERCAVVKKVNYIPHHRTSESALNLGWFLL